MSRSPKPPLGLQPLDKHAIGARIRQIRLRCGLRQRELALRLGTSQSAVHKYEHGVIPEARRLLALASLGQTTVEWILTGRHAEHGATEQERPDAELLVLAQRLRSFRQVGAARVREALSLLEAAAAAAPEPGTLPALAPAVGPTLQAAAAIVARVLETLLDQAQERLGSD